MRFRHGITVTVLRETHTITGAVTLTEDGTIGSCGWSPAVQGITDNAETAELGFGYPQTITGRTLYTPPGAGLVAGHRVRFPDGTLWEVIGEVGPWRSPLTGWAPGDQAELRRVTVVTTGWRS
ncbi:MAG: hypothetical protein ACRDTZ_00245 [Pseudonocardiaceae bacterium]